MSIRKKIVLISFVFALMAIAGKLQAQCAMCAASAEVAMRDNKERAEGLNTGILYLLAAPYLLVTGVGIIWYKKYRKKNVGLNINNDN